MTKNTKIGETKEIEIVIDSKIRILQNQLSGLIEQKLKDDLILINPLWEENKKRGYWTGNTPEKLYFMIKEDGYLILPRGYINKLAILLKNNDFSFKINDKTRQLNQVDYTFKGNLYDFQKKASEAILSRYFGVFNCPTGGGKTVVALYCIAVRKQPALVIVHTKELLYQWQKRAIQFLGLTEEEIGLIGDGHKKIGEKLTISIVKSLYKCSKEVNEKIGYLIVDECHRTPSRTFTEAASAFESRYMLGLSATPYRRDKLTDIINYYLGNQIYSIAPQELQQINKIMKASLKIRMTSFDYDYRDSEDYQPMLGCLIEDSDRNLQIVDDIVSESQKKRGICLVISDRKDHCSILYDLVESKGLITRLLTGDTPKKLRKTIVDELNASKIEVLVATSQLIGEGFDIKKLSSLFLTTPVKFSGRVKQYVGRILRTDDDKKDAIIFDYVDIPGVLRASFKTRYFAYKELGIKDFKANDRQEYDQIWSNKNY